MSKKKVEYAQYFKVGQQVKLALRSSGSVSREFSGEITGLSGDLAEVEILGGDLPSSLQTPDRSVRFNLAGWTGWGFYQCEAQIAEPATAKEVRLRLLGAIEEKQRREYFRLDVTLPVILRVPDSQSPSTLREQWLTARKRNLASPPPRLIPTAKGHRAVLPGGEEIQPLSVNLSGGGLRLRVPGGIVLGTWVHVDLYLPFSPPRIISAVAEVLRCNELTLRLEKSSVFIAAMKFIHIDEQDREAVIAYLFAEQRLQLQAEAERNELPTPPR